MIPHLSRNDGLFLYPACPQYSHGPPALFFLPEQDKRQILIKGLDHQIIVRIENPAEAFVFRRK